MPAAAVALRLGASTTLAHHVLPPLLAEFQRRWPAVALRVQPANSALVAAALVRGALDLGFVEGTARAPGLHYERLLFDELVAVRGATAAGPPVASLPLAEALAHPLVLREAGSGTLDVLEAALQAHGIALASLPALTYCADTEAIKGLLLAKSGTLGFISRRALVTELVSGQLEEVPIRGLLLARELLAVWRSEPALPEAARQFLALCRERA
ncbi:LysR substrate-binding domain-containing protein [Hymenobacter profundi]|nr:LysR substrate-binding domain-containing protein [Hymenobacter profundi]